MKNFTLFLLFQCATCTKNISRAYTKKANLCVYVQCTYVWTFILGPYLFLTHICTVYNYAAIKTCAAQTNLIALSLHIRKQQTNPIFFVKWQIFLHAISDQIHSGNRVKGVLNTIFLATELLGSRRGWL